MTSNPQEAFRLTLFARKKFLSALIAVLAMVGFAQTSQPPTAQDVIAYLNQSIDWHRQLTVEEQIATDPTDVLFLNDDRQTADQALRLSFDFAKTYSQQLSGQAGAQPAPPTGAEPSRYQSLFKAAADTDNEAQQTQAELESDKKQLQTARGAQRKKLQATVNELQGELDLVQARAKTLHDILQFVGGAGGKSTGGNLPAQIAQLQRSVPELEADNTKSNSTPNAQAAKSAAQPSGILNLIEDLLTLSHKMHSLDQRTRASDDLLQTAQQLQAPFVSDVTNIAQKGEQLARQADTSDASQLEQLRHELDSLTAQFKQSSGVVLPLGKQTVLLDLYKSNLARWRSVVKSQYATAMRSLLIRALVFGIILVFVIVLAQLWRRAVFRYVHDVRRRYQFLLLRRIILWIAIAITVAFAMATEIGSIATFAGLITAGIAVALQNVILAIAGYFFLIGRYGVRVGDRIQISGVTGDVIDIGLIRLHLMEVGGSGTDRQPTGRVVVFSNAVVFQPSASFYKQIPGTNFVWHEVSLTLSPESDYALAEKRMLGAVEKVYAGYHEHIEAQHRAMEQTLSVAVEVPRPHSRLRLAQSGLEILIRYPVEIETATEVDDQIARELLRALEQSPKLKLVGSGSPNIQPVPEEPKAVA